jgi:hypothetical protein
VYRGLGVREVWVWRSRQIHVYRLDAGNYEEVPASAILPDVDLALLARLAEHANQSAAVRELRAALRKNRGRNG